MIQIRNDTRIIYFTLFTAASAACAVIRNLSGIRAVPVIIFLFFYTAAAVICSAKPDICDLTSGGRNEPAPVSMTVMNSLSFGLAVLLTRLHNKAGRI